MKINISKTIKIEDLSDWFRAAPPKGEEKQWKDGRSAKEMARFATSKEFPCLIKNVLNECKLNDQDFECEPEALTTFPPETMGTRGPRNHDLLMIGDDCVIGIEAKVSESFDEQIDKKRYKAGANMKKRLDGAIQYVYGNNSPKEVEDMHYQLFSATIGTVEEAKEHGKKNAITLVIVFKGDACEATDPNYGNNVKANNEAFEKFYDSVKKKEAPDGPIKVASADDIKCWLKKVEVTVKTNNTQYTTKWQ